MPDYAARLEAAHSERNRFIAFAFAAAELVIEADETGEILFSAGAAENLFGLSNDDLVGSNLYQLIAPKDRAGLEKALAGFPAGKRMKSRIVAARVPVGPPRALRLRAYRLPGNSRIAHISISLFHADIDAGEPARSRPGGARDAVSGLAQKEDFADAVRQRLVTLQADGESSNLTMIDLESLADVRPHLADGAEQELLAKVGQMLSSNSLDESLGGRIDKDKFGFLHDPSLDVEAVSRSVEQLVRSASPWAANFKLNAATVEMDAAGLNEEDMGQAVLYTLNSFNESNGGEVKFASLSEGCKEMLSETMVWQQRIKRTIADDAFTLVYQPIVDLTDGAAHHYEALTRLNDDPNASPYKFITMAEQLGKIAEFDGAVMARAFKILRAAGTARAAPIAVNISGRSLSTPEFVKSLTGMLKLNSDLTAFILFEVTESSKIIDLPSANKALKTFRKLGVQVCLDDFGVGAVAFEYLRAMRVDFVKIDGSFVREAAHSKFSGAFIKSICALCRELGIQTIAEMIEDDAAARLMRAAGVDHGQGWHFGKPNAELPWDGGAYGGAAIPASRTDFDPTVGRRVTAR